MPFARPFVKLILIVGAALLVVGRLTGQYGTWELLKYVSFLVAACAVLSVFSKKEEDSLLKLCGHLLIVAGIIGGAGYGLYRLVSNRVPIAHVTPRDVGDGIDRGVRATGGAAGSVIKSKFDGFMDGVEKTTDEHHH